MRPIFLRIAAVAVVAVAGGAAWDYQRKHPPKHPVTVVPVRQADLLGEWSATGYVECRSADATAPQVGRVAKVLVDEGDSVKAGQVIAILDSAQQEAVIAGQGSAVEVAAWESAAAESGLRETQKLNRERVRVAEAEVDAARTREAHARISLESSRRIELAAIQAARSHVATAEAELADVSAGPRPEETAQAQAALEDAVAAAERTRIEFTRQETLFRERAVPRRAVDDAREAVQRSEAGVRRLRAALELVRAGRRSGEIQTARSRVNSAQEDVRAAEARLSTLEALQQAVVEAQAAVRTAQAALGEARTMLGNTESLRRQSLAAGKRVSQARASQRSGRASMSETRVRAPFDGMVGRRHLHPGDMASSTQPILTVLETRRTWVAAEVDAQDLAPVHDGQQVELNIPAYPSRSFPGRVSLLGREATPQTEVRTSARIVRVKVSLNALPERDRELFKPGLEVHVTGKARLAESALLVPNDAIQADVQGTFTYVIDGGIARRRRVRTGFVGATETQVVDGLRTGESVVAAGKEGLKEGMPVQPNAPKEAAP